MRNGLFVFRAYFLIFGSFALCSLTQIIKFMKKTLWSLLALAALSTACKKEEEPAPSKESQLMAKNWQITDHLQIIGTQTPSVYAQMQDCVKDNLYRFSTNNVLSRDEGATKCFTSSPQTDTIYWTMTGEASLITVWDLDTTRYTIESVNETQMRLRFQSGNNITNEYVYTAR